VARRLRAQGVDRHRRDKDPRAREESDELRPGNPRRTHEHTFKPRQSPRH
jgi:hypothetical protein